MPLRLDAVRGQRTGRCRTLDRWCRVVDPKVLRSFLAVCELRSFSQAARLRGMSQPTITQHVQRLEGMAGTPLFVRSGKAIALTSAGESLRGLAVRSEEAHQEILRFLGAERRLGRVRFGAAEDFASTQLPMMLRAFTAAHPDIVFSLSVQEYFPLIDALKSEELDLVLVKQFDGHLRPAFRGTVVATDQLVWVADRGADPQRDEPVPLVTYRARSMTRDRVLGMLSKAGRAWRPACECQGLNSIVAAIRAGLGVGVLPRSLVPRDLVVCPPTAALPELGEVSFVLLRRPGLRGDDATAVDALANTITSAVLRSLQ